MTYRIRRMTSGEWRELRAIKLEAVQDTPTAFSSPYAEVAAYSAAYWQQRATTEATSPEGATFIACTPGNDWVGTASIEPLVEVPDHAHLHAVYVRADHRGSTGPAARLVAAAVDFAEEHIAVAHLSLGVHEDNARALAFYRKAGFHLTGKVIPYRPNPVENVLIMEYTAFKPARINTAG